MVAQLKAAPVPVFSLEEVVEALSWISRGKSSGSGIIWQFIRLWHHLASHQALDLLCGGHCSLHELLVVGFMGWAHDGYPRVLTMLLFMPIYNSHGSVDACNNFHTISLIHPLGSALRDGC